MEHYGFSATFACAPSNCTFHPDLILSDYSRVLHQHSSFGNASKVLGCFYNCEQDGNAVFFFLLCLGGKSGFHPSAAVARDLKERAAYCHIHQIEKKQKKEAVRLIDILCHVCCIS